jgi:hypothetical protein
MKPLLEFQNHIVSLYPNLRTHLSEVGPGPIWMLEVYTSESRIDVIWGEELPWGIAELNAENEDERWFDNRNDAEFVSWKEALNYVAKLIERRGP